MDDSVSSPGLNGENIFETISPVSTAPANSIPIELLQAIMKHALPLDFLVLPRMELGLEDFDGPWLKATRLKRSMSLVCRSWNAAALPLMYRHPVIENSSRATTFLSVLKTKSAPCTVTQYVKSIDFRFGFESEDRDSDSAKSFDLLCDIRKLCLNLTSVGLESFYPLQFVEPSQIAQLRLTSLTLHDNSARTADDILNILRATSSTITYLFLALGYIVNEDKDSDADDELEGVNSKFASDLSSHPKHIHFDKLEQLELSFPKFGNAPIWLMKYWALPQLVKFSGRSQPGRTNVYIVTSILQPNKPNIQVLQLRIPNVVGPSAWHALRELLKGLTSLRHLILDFDLADKGLENDTLEFVDIWEDVEDATEDHDSFSDKSDAEPEDQDNSSSCSRRRPLVCRTAATASTTTSRANIFPSLRGTRILDQRLSHLGNFPLDIPPERVLRKEDEFCMDYDGISVKHEVGRLICV